MPDGSTRECAVGRRRRAADGSWWYELSPAPLEPVAPGPEAEPGGWPPPAADWRAHRRYYATGERWFLHRGGCWIEGEKKLTVAEARALMASPLGVGCDVCDAEDGLQSLD
ncbi:DUF6233 domain-containing protein [Streptomyces fildesensis]|uniref:DUF6233 domain-containing protein n=1 Tax=Streptomyces fildesensis TaxID=375757 RepID=UPI0034D79C61